MKNSKSIVKVLLENKRVNNYTKMLITLSRLDYYKDNYIPNKKLMNILKINKNRVIVILKQLVEDNVIIVYHKGKKRYFKYIINEEKININDDIVDNKRRLDLFDYDWLNDPEVRK